MSQPIIRVNNLVRYFGDFCAVDRLSFEIAAGQVVGFIGANGAGKTTTMRMMTALEIPTSGSIEIDGKDVQNFPNDVQKILGWMPDYFGTYPNMDVWEYLDFYARAYNLRGSQRTDRIEEIMDFTDLMPLADRQCGKLSKGQKQRLCLARTLLSDPKVLILDEPAAGLDPKARVEFRRLVQLLKEQGKTIFISSHILSELGEMCDDLLFIDEGRLVHQGNSDSLKYSGEVNIKVGVRLLAPMIEIERWLSTQPHIHLETELQDGVLLRFEIDAEQKANEREMLSAALNSMHEAKLNPYDFHRQEQKLEDAFINILSDQKTPLKR
ncbi:MAG: ABC transporter ATP-binding protein [Opitutaceae bacterium]